MVYAGIDNYSSFEWFWRTIVCSCNSLWICLNVLSLVEAFSMFIYVDICVYLLQCMNVTMSRHWIRMPYGCWWKSYMFGCALWHINPELWWVHTKHVWLVLMGYIMSWKVFRSHDLFGFTMILTINFCKLNAKYKIMAYWTIPCVCIWSFSLRTLHCIWVIQLVGADSIGIYCIF